MAKTISICIPCYNSEKYIRTTIESALAQTIPADEILISDDRPPDRSFEIVKEYDGLARVRILRPPQRTTLGGHYRFLLQQATGDYLCFLSSDDALMPSFVETMHRELAGEDKVGLITSACIETDSRLAPLKTRGTGTPKQSLNPPDGFSYMTAGCIYTISFSLLSRQILMTSSAASARSRSHHRLVLGHDARRSRQNQVRPPAHGLLPHSLDQCRPQSLEEWQEAVVVMLEFLREYLGPALGDQLLPWLKITYAQIENRRLGLSAPTPTTSAKNRLNNLAKRAIALRYRSLPESIRKAEQGIGIALPSRPQERK